MGVTVITSGLLLFAWVVGTLLKYPFTVETDSVLFAASLAISVFESGSNGYYLTSNTDELPASNTSL